MIRIAGTILSGLLGLAFGSFLNVCLSRWPEGESVVKPRSHCRNCGRTLAWWENVPLVSWIALGGRCRTCKARISWRYPLVELAVGILWAYVASQPFADFPSDDFLGTLLIYTFASRLLTMMFLWMLVALAILDAEHLWLPNFLTLTGAAIGFLNAAANPFILLLLTRKTGIPFTDEFEHAPFGLWTPTVGRLGAILAAAGLILLIRWTYWLIRRREGIGLGDAKLMAMLGAWLGLSGALLSFAIGILLGSVFALAILALPAARRESDTWLLSKLPLGTFLCVGGIISALWGQPIIAAYFRWVGLS
jgi:leader peptidase (prepilin peptidase) / N-methyltransferase